MTFFGVRWPAVVTFFFSLRYLVCFGLRGGNVVTHQVGPVDIHHDATGAVRSAAAAATTTTSAGAQGCLCETYSARCRTRTCVLPVVVCWQFDMAPKWCLRLGVLDNPEIRRCGQCRAIYVLDSRCFRVPGYPLVIFQALVTQRACCLPSLWRT